MIGKQVSEAHHLTFRRALLAAAAYRVFVSFPVSFTTDSIK